MKHTRRVQAKSKLRTTKAANEKCKGQDSAWINGFDVLDHVLHGLFPSGVKMGHALGVTKNSLPAVLNNAMERLLAATHRGMPQGASI